MTAWSCLQTPLSNGGATPHDSQSTVALFLIMNPSAGHESEDRVSQSSSIRSFNSRDSTIALNPSIPPVECARCTKHPHCLPAGCFPDDRIQFWSVDIKSFSIATILSCWSLGDNAPVVTIRLSKLWVAFCLVSVGLCKLRSLLRPKLRPLEMTEALIFFAVSAKKQKDKAESAMTLLRIQTAQSTKAQS